MIKTFVLDTNVLLHSSHSLESFQDNNIAIPMAVIEELDKFKKNHDELGRNARRVIRSLDKLRAAGHLADGVAMKGIIGAATGKLSIVCARPGEGYEGFLRQIVAAGWNADMADNRILAAAMMLQQHTSHVIFVSKDINLRLKADALGLVVEDFEKEKVNFDTLYTGFRTVDVDDETVNRFYREKRLVVDDEELMPNEFVVLRSNSNAKHTALGRCWAAREVRLVEQSENFHVGTLVPRNREQRMALELLLDPAVKLVTLVGGAGTGKTLLALAAGLLMTEERKQYEKLLVTRPIVPLGNDIGYLPGGKNEKLQSWMQPIFDNLEFLLAGNGGDARRNPGTRIAALISKGIVELEALTYIRGRSIPAHYVIVDEAQNLTPHEVKTIVSRAGEGTKMVLTGDPNQIDNPYLDASSNGLTVTVEQFKHEAIHGHVTLRKSERSELAALAARLL